MALMPFLGRGSTTVWDPFSLTNVWDPFESVVGQLQNTPAARDVASVINTRVDWVETPTEHIIKADLPGLGKEEVKVEVEDGNILKLSGERSREVTDEKDQWHRVERAYGKFVRRFRLPDNAKVDEISAKVENGVLEVHVPKSEPKKAEARSVDVS